MNDCTGKRKQVQVEVILATILKERRHFEAIKKRTQKGCFWLLESFG